MLDSYSINPGIGFVNATVTENRAPTDDSVRLLKEMEEAARKKVIESTVVSDTHFECKIHKTHDIFSLQDLFVIVYSLNGKKRVVNCSVDSWRDLPPGEIAVTIRNKVAEDISNEMLKVAFMNVEKW